MIKSFKYTTEEHYVEFVLKCTNDEEDATAKLMNHNTVMLILQERILPEDWDEERALPEVEVMLHYFCDVEEYELCQQIINNWPELKNDC
jgi:hypothetical protein